MYFVPAKTAHKVYSVLYLQTMDDYQAAFIQRHTDTEALCNSDRKIAAMHFGGITIECLLKSMILASLPKRAIREWKIASNIQGIPLLIQGIAFLKP